MFNFSWSELALIAVVALVVIGPKDLPRVMRTVGMWTRRARAIANEFQGSIEQMVREAELDEVRKQVNEVTNLDFEREFNRAIDPEGEMQRSLAEPVLAEPMAERVSAAAAAIEAAPPAALAAEPPAAAAAIAAAPAEAAPAAPPLPDSLAAAEAPAKA